MYPGGVYWGLYNYARAFLSIPAGYPGYTDSPFKGTFGILGILAFPLLWYPGYPRMMLHPGYHDPPSGGKRPHEPT